MSFGCIQYMKIDIFSKDSQLTKNTNTKLNCLTSSKKEKLLPCTYIFVFILYILCVYSKTSRQWQYQIGGKSKVVVLQISIFILNRLRFLFPTFCSLNDWFLLLIFKIVVSLFSEYYWQHLLFKKFVCFAIQKWCLGSRQMVLKSSRGNPTSKNNVHTSDMQV